MTTTTAIPQPTDWREHARCSHGLGDTIGYVVTYTRFDNATGTTTREDIEYVEDATHYGYAVDLVHQARERIDQGEVDATYAVIDCVYEGEHRPI
jgi:hypothetical protein